MKTPFFILCSGRSGSTLLSSMLNMHPDIHVPVELWGLFSTLPARLRSYGDLADTRNAYLLADDLQRIGQLNEFQMQFDRDFFVATLARSGQELRSVVECFYETLLRDSCKSRLGDKTPNNLPFVREIGGIFPEAKIVHLVRDGRDCALSMMKSRSGLNYRNVYELASAWPENNKRAAEYGNENPDMYYRVRYEDLLADARGTLERLCTFIDEPFVPEMLDFSRGKFARDNSALLGHHRNLAKGIMSDNVYKWRAGMSGDQVKIYDSIAGDVLDMFGYAVESDRQGWRWRIMKLKYLMATRGRKLLRGLKNYRKSAWAAICVAAKRMLTSVGLSRKSPPLSS